MPYERFGQTQAGPLDQIVYAYEGQGFSPALIARLAPCRPTYTRRMLSTPNQPYLLTSNRRELEQLAYIHACRKAFGTPGFLKDRTI